MPLPSSGRISTQTFRDFFDIQAGSDLTSEDWHRGGNYVRSSYQSKNGTQSINQQVPNSGRIALSDLYGVHGVTTVTEEISGNLNPTVFGTPSGDTATADAFDGAGGVSGDAAATMNDPYTSPSDVGVNPTTYNDSDVGTTNPATNNPPTTSDTAGGNPANNTSAPGTGDPTEATAASGGNTNATTYPDGGGGPPNFGDPSANPTTGGNTNASTGGNTNPVYWNPTIPGNPNPTSPGDNSNGHPIYGGGDVPSGGNPRPPNGGNLGGGNLNPTVPGNVNPTVPGTNNPSDAVPGNVNPVVPATYNPSDAGTFNPVTGDSTGFPGNADPHFTNPTPGNPTNNTSAPGTGDPTAIPGNPTGDTAGGDGSDGAGGVSGDAAPTVNDPYTSPSDVGMNPNIPGNFNPNYTITYEVLV